MRKQNGFVVWLLLLPILIIVILATLFVFSNKNKQETSNAPDNPPLTSLTVPYIKISDLSGVGPYSTNQETAGYIHNGLNFMANTDLVEYRSISAGLVKEARVFYDNTRTDTHPQVNLQVLYNKNTTVVYTFEPYSKDVADAERQLTLINVKEGDTITAGQSLGKLIKTAPQSHVHIHIMKDNKEICFADMFTDQEQLEMLGIVEVAPNKQAKLCYE
ncbi:MAG: hypothetical protein Q7T41_03465 [Candidatus Saccharibacteria bacterium]|nr:hypothetical protein [Candidatus Saccharibacteria bacterium]